MSSQINSYNPTWKDSSVSFPDNREDCSCIHLNVISISYIFMVKDEDVMDGVGMTIVCISIASAVILFYFDCIKHSNQIANWSWLQRSHTPMTAAPLFAGPFPGTIQSVGSNL